MRTRLSAALALFIAALGMAHAQQTPDGIAGTWKPQDPARADALFRVGLSDVTAEGLQITRTGERLVVTRLDTAGALETLAAIGANVRPESTYRLDPQSSAPSALRFQGQHGHAVLSGTTLVIEMVAAHASWQTTYEVDGDRMKITTVAASRPTAVVQFFERVK
jgi:hypothetical protein